MILKSFKTPQEFLKEGEAFLLKNESFNNLFLGLANRLCEQNPDGGDPFFYLLKNELDEVIGAAMRSAPIRPLIITEMNNSGLRLLSEELKKKNISLVGAVGHKETIEHFGEVWGSSSFEVMGQGVYECRNLIPPSLLKGELYQVQLDDPVGLEAAVEFGAGFIKECFPKHREPVVEARKSVEFYVERGLLFLWKSDTGEFVSMACNNRESKNAGTIGWVFTPSDKRGNGYGSMVTYGATREIFKKGKTLANLFTDLSNPTSNSIYQKLGYKLIGNSIHIEFS